MKYCKCGCGQEIKEWKEFIRGHTQTNYSREDWTNYFKEKMEVT